MLLNSLSLGLWSLIDLFNSLKKEQRSFINALSLVGLAIAFIGIHSLIQFKLVQSALLINILHIVFSNILLIWTYPKYIASEADSNKYKYTLKSVFSDFRNIILDTDPKFWVSRLVFWLSILVPWIFSLHLFYNYWHIDGQKDVGLLVLNIIKALAWKATLLGLVFSIMDVFLSKSKFKSAKMSDILISVFTLSLFFVLYNHLKLESILNGYRFEGAKSWFDYKFSSSIVDGISYLIILIIVFGFYFYNSFEFKIFKRFKIKLSLFLKALNLFLIAMLITLSLSYYLQIGADYKLMQLDKIKSKHLVSGLTKKLEFLDFIIKRLHNNSINYDLKREYEFINYLITQYIPSGNFPKAIPNGFNLEVENSYYVILEAIQETTPKLRKKTNLNSKILQLTNRGKIEIPFIKNEIELIQALNHMDVEWGMDLYYPQTFYADSNHIPILKDGERWIAVMRKLDDRDSYLVYDSFYFTKTPRSLRNNKIDISLINEWSKESIEKLISDNKEYYLFIGKKHTSLFHDFSYNMMLGDLWYQKHGNYFQAKKHYQTIDKYSLYNPRKEFMKLFPCLEQNLFEADFKDKLCLNRALANADLADLPWKMLYELLYQNIDQAYDFNQVKENNIKLAQLIYSKNPQDIWIELNAQLESSIGYDSLALLNYQMISKYDQIFIGMIKSSLYENAITYYKAEQLNISDNVKKIWLSHLINFKNPIYKNSDEILEGLKRSILLQPYEKHHYQRLLGSFESKLSKGEKKFYTKWLKRLENPMGLR